jgi:hypothetical protein
MVIVIARPLDQFLDQFHGKCAGAVMMYSQAENVFFLGYNFALKSFASLREAFSNAYPNKKVSRKRLCTDW